MLVTVIALHVNCAKNYITNILNKKKKITHGNDCTGLFFICFSGIKEKNFFLHYEVGGKSILLASRVLH